MYRLVMFFFILALNPRLSFAKIQNTSSFGILSTYQKVKGNTGDDSILISGSQLMGWNVGNLLRNEGEFEAEIISGEFDQSRSLRLSDALNWKGQNLSASLRLSSSIRESDGSSFFSLAERLDQSQQIASVNSSGNLQFYTQSNRGDLDLLYTFERYSNVSYSHRLEKTEIADAIRDRNNYQSILLNSQSGSLFLSPSPFWGLRLQQVFNKLYLQADTQLLAIDTDQKESIRTVSLEFNSYTFFTFSLGLTQQQIDFEESTSTADGPVFQSTIQLSRISTLNLSASLLKVKFFDDEESSFLNSRVNYIYNIDRINQIQLDYERRIDTINDIFEILNTRTDDLQRRGFTSESASFNYIRRIRNLETSYLMRHSNLFINKDSLSFQETLVQGLLTLRLNILQTMSFNLDLRQRTDYLVAGEPTTQILGLGTTYRHQLNNFTNSMFTGGFLTATLSGERQETTLDNSYITRLVTSIGLSLIF